MKRGGSRFRTFVAALVVAAGLTICGIAQAQVAPTCPTNFSCAISVASTNSLMGNQNDGLPTTIIGVATFNSAGTTVTLNSELNINGKFKSQNQSGTCSIQTINGQQIGVLDFTGSSGPKLLFLTTDGGAALRLINNPSTNDPNVLFGVCEELPTA